MIAGEPATHTGDLSGRPYACKSDIVNIVRTKTGNRTEKPGLFD